MELSDKAKKIDDHYNAMIAEGCYAHLILEEDLKLFLEDGQKLLIPKGHQIFQVLNKFRVRRAEPAVEVLGENEILILAVDGKNRYTKKGETVKIKVSFKHVERLIYIH